MNKAAALAITAELLAITAAAASGITAALDGQGGTALQCFLAVSLLLLPTLLGHFTRIKLPAPLRLIAVAFLFASAFLGEVRDCYLLLPLWDSALHLCAGFMTTAIGFSLGGSVSDEKKAWFTVLFAFCFSMTSEVLWEFYEFAADMLFFTDMQKDTFVGTVSSVRLGSGRISVESASLNGIPLTGWLDIGLIDTMKDLLVNAAGSVLFLIFGFVYLKCGRAAWITRLLPTLRKTRK